MHAHNCFTALLDFVQDYPGHGWLVGWGFMALSAQKGHIMPATRVSRHQKGKTRKVKPIWIYWSKRL